ncbi:hypothetical protein [Sphaerisporangium corydalis]|uniref:SWIM-type domain-containing protein n=1 Tax=Sphaerisporangium corydalis TaxID=1441875 RepID=A0ABV9E849_9ACTN|nr:hypothetical protein [Sphaerisporangium corydalis]
MRLPPVAPHVVASAVEDLTSRLLKKLDAAIGVYAAVPPVADGDAVHVRCGEDAVVILVPGPDGTVATPDAAHCTCLLAPRCLHRAAVLSACPLADPATTDPATTTDPAATTDPDGTTGPDGTTDPAATSGPDVDAGPGPLATSGVPGAAPLPPAVAPDATAARRPVTPGTGPDAGASAPGPSEAQVKAAAGLWRASATVLAAGVPAADAVLQAELLRASHSARLAGLFRAEAAALRVVRGVRAARERHDGHRLADLVTALRELLVTSGGLAAGDPDPALIGVARRGYQPGGGLRVYGVCREPVISDTGYGGVVTHLLTENGDRLSVADVKPGGPARARGAGTGPVALCTALDHAQLARGGLLISGATVSPDGRLGAGRGVRASPSPGVPWSAGPLASLFERPPAEAVGALLTGSPTADLDGGGDQGQNLVGCDLVIVGAAGDHLLARAPDGPLIRLVAASLHPELAHSANLRLLASRPGLSVRVLGRPDLDRAATLRPLAVGPVPDAEATLRLPGDWLGRADLGYDRLQGSHLPARGIAPPPEPLVEPGTDPLAGSPLWRVRRLVELAVTGGRRAVAEYSRSAGLRTRESRAEGAMLRRTGFPVAAELTATLAAEADRRGRDAFGRLTDSGPERYASAWLTTAVHLATAERTLIRASWTTGHIR